MGASRLTGSLTLTKIRDAFAVLKNLVLESRQTQVGAQHGPGDEKLQRQVSELRAVLQQRDGEIEILVNMVKKGKTALDVGHASRASSSSGGGGDDRAFTQHPDTRRQQEGFVGGGDGERNMLSERSTIDVRRTKQTLAEQKIAREQANQERLIQRHLFGVRPPTDSRIFEDAAGMRHCQHFPLFA